MSTASDMLAQYLAAEAAVLSGQSFKWGERSLTRADLAEIRAGRQEWERKAASASRSGRVGVALADFGGCTSREGRECGRWGRN